MDTAQRLLETPSAIAITIGQLILFVLALYWLYRDAESAIDYDVSLPKECSPRWKGEQLSEPSIKISGSSAIQCYCPATGQSLGLVNPATPDSIDRAVIKAQEAQLEWSKTTFAERRRVLKSVLRYVLKHQDDIITAACLDSGKTRIDALFGEILVTVEKLKWTIDHGEKALQPSSRPTNLLMMYKSNTVHYEPLGVVAACVSWNYPFHNLIGPMISSLFTGNAILVKASEQTAWSAPYFTSIVRNALTAHGHSPHLATSLACWPATANHLTSHPSISHLTFIGSRPVAHHVCASAARSLTPVLVELGGKDPALVLDPPLGHAPTSDKEMSRIASILMRGVYQAAGQNCIGIERIVALPHSYTRLIALLEPRIASLRVGYALQEEIDVGAMISSASFDRLEALISHAVASGAKLLVGGKRYVHPSYPSGSYFSPTLLVDVRPDMRIAREELFAPIALLLRAETVSDAIAIANSTEYALGASVFGPTTGGQARRDLDRCVKEIKAGMVAVNDFAAFYAVQLPFGGVGGSGYGRFAGEEGLRGLCNLKSVCRDREWMGIKTGIPGELDYPVPKRGTVVGKGVVEFGYGMGIGEKIRGLRKILGL